MGKGVFEPTKDATGPFIVVCDPINLGSVRDGG
jgi:hypothetical protein